MKHIFTVGRGFSKWRVLLACVSLFCLAPANAQEASPEPDEARVILSRSDEIRFPREGFQVDVSIQSTAPGQEPEMRKYQVLSKDNENTIVRVVEPASERGQIMLMKGSDLWIFMPDVSQPIRLGLSQRLTGEVSNGDIARANFSGDYTPKILRRERVEGVEHVVLELLAARRGVTYHRVLLWVNAENDRPHKAEFYSLSKRLLKTCTYEDFKAMGGKTRPTRLVMEDALKAGEKSVLSYTQMRLRALPDKVFTPDYLKKLAQ